MIAAALLMSSSVLAAQLPAGAVMIKHVDHQERTSMLGNGVTSGYINNASSNTAVNVIYRPSGLTVSQDVLPAQSTNTKYTLTNSDTGWTSTPFRITSSDNKGCDFYFSSYGEIAAMTVNQVGSVAYYCNFNAAGALQVYVDSY